MASLDGCPCCSFTLPENLFLPRDQASKQPSDGLEEADPISPSLALTRLAAANATIIDTHSHAHLEQPAVSDSVHDASTASQAEIIEGISQPFILSCAVAPEDWNQCLEYASQSTFRTPALGVHPWYIDRLLDSDNNLNNHWLKDLEALLQLHPHCIVGEIGLCKHAKLLRTFPGGKAMAMELQRTVLTQQLILAARYQRPVSVHCVDQHAVLLQILKEMPQDHLPPAIAMHSFTGTAHHVQQLLRWEDTIR